MNLKTIIKCLLFLIFLLNPLELKSKKPPQIIRSSSFVSREGALKTIPHYPHRRVFSQNNFSAPNNKKRNFRVRAYNYYIDGGNAGSQILQQHATRSLFHQSPARRWQKAKFNQKSVADIKHHIRQKQRSK